MKHNLSLHLKLFPALAGSSVLGLAAMQTAHAAIISAPLFVTEAKDSKIQYVDLATNSVKTLYQENDVRFNAAAVDSVNQNLYFFKITNSRSGETSRTYNELWRMDLSGGLQDDTAVGSANSNYGKLQRLGVFDLGAKGSGGESPILGATFNNGNLLLVGTNATQVWAIPTTTLDDAATTNREVDNNPFTSEDWATTTLTLPSSGTSMQPGDILVGGGKLWFTGTGAGGSLGGPRSIAWNSADINTTVNSTTATTAAVGNTTHLARPGATYDSSNQVYYSYEQSTGDFFTVKAEDLSKGSTLISGSDDFKVFGDLTNFTQLEITNYVPEPSTALLGLLGCMALLRRRR